MSNLNSGESASELLYDRKEITGVYGSLSAEGESILVNSDQEQAAQEVKIDTSIKALSDLVMKSGHDKYVLGQPPFFPPTSDIFKRNWFENMAVNSPIITLVPGVPNIGTSEAGAEIKENAAQLSSLFQRLKESGEGMSEAEKEAYAKELQDMVSSLKTGSVEKDNRFFHFSADPVGYSMAFNGIFSVFTSRFIDGLGGFLVDNPVEKNTFGGISYYYDKATNISESISNTYEDSFVKGLFDGLGDLKKKATETLEAVFNSKLEDPAEGEKDRINVMINSMSSDSEVNAAWNGSKLLVPKMWQESTFNRSYQISFVFESLYGNKDDLLREVYVPYLSLLSLALPLQTHQSAYSRPFLLQADAPGWFHLDCAVITDMSIKRSPGDKDWTYNNLSRKIEVEITLTDLYPTIMLSSFAFSTTSNIGMNSYLASIAGWDYKKMSKKSYFTAAKEGINYIYNEAGDLPEAISDSLSFEYRNILSYFGI